MANHSANVKEATRMKQLEFLEVFQKNYGNVKASCDEFQITKKTYYDWCHNRYFARLVGIIRAGITKGFTEEVAMPVYYTLISRGNVPMLTRYLDARGIDKVSNEVHQKAKIDFIFDEEEVEDEEV